MTSQQLTASGPGICLFSLAAGSLTTCACAGGGAVSHYPFLTSKERDVETGLDYFLARYYSSIQARFTSPDEFKGGPEELFEEVDPHDPLFYADIAEPQSLNKYQYALNNPLKYVDPNGHQATVADRLKAGAKSVAKTAVETFEGAVSAYFEDQGVGGTTGSQNSVGRGLGHTAALVQSAAEIVGGVYAITGGGAEAAITSPATTTGVGAVVPAAGVAVAGVGAVTVVHGTAVGLNTLNNIFRKRRSNEFTSKTRKEIIEENAANNDGVNKCENCGRDVKKIQNQAGVKTPEDQLQIHHKKPIKDGGGREASNGKVECPKCHKEEHRQ